MATPENIARWMRQQVVQSGARGIIVGLSGGIDSAVVARLAQLAAPGAALGVVMPCHSDPQDERDAMLVAKQFSLPTVRVDLSWPFDALANDLQAALRAVPTHMYTTEPADPLRAPLPLANVKPRLRMATLYYLANTLNYIVAGTGNRSELSIGYFTKYGDGGSDMLPIGRLLKRQVREVARELGIPAAIVDRTPSAGLWLGQSDEEEMGFTYDELERYLDEGADAVAPALAMKIERLIRKSEHKRQLPPMPDV